MGSLKRMEMTVRMLGDEEKAAIDGSGDDYTGYRVINNDEESKEATNCEVGEAKGKGE